jgi:hypothetical protein
MRMMLWQNWKITPWNYTSKKGLVITTDDIFDDGYQKCTAWLLPVERSSLLAFE